MKSNVIGLFLATIAIVIAVISITASISDIERETGLYDKILYSYNVQPYNKQFIPIISNISNQVPPNESIAISLPSSQFEFCIHRPKIVHACNLDTIIPCYFCIRNFAHYHVILGFYSEFSKLDY